MQKAKRLRVFAGPNGSGKSTIFSSFQRKYDPGYFINADKIEKQLGSSGFIDLEVLGIKATEEDLAVYKNSHEGRSLLAKAAKFVLHMF